MGRDARAQVCEELPGERSRIGARARHHIRGERRVIGDGDAGDGHGGDAGVRRELRLDLAWIDADAADLELVVEPATIDERAVRGAA